MKSRSISKQINKNKVRPSEQYPGLIQKLVRINLLARKLHEETDQRELAKLLEVSQQAIQYHARKEKNEKSL